MSADQAIVAVKAVAMVLMFTLIVIMGNVPLRVKSFRANEKLLSVASAFSGGLFISVGLIHILPEAGDDFTSYIGTDNHFPFQMLITVLSFSLVLMIEKVIGGESHHHHHDHEKDAHAEDVEHQHKHNHDHNHNHQGDNKSNEEEKSSDNGFNSKMDSILQNVQKGYNQADTVLQNDSPEVSQQMFYQNSTSRDDTSPMHSIMKHINQNASITNAPKLRQKDLELSKMDKSSLSSQKDTINRDQQSEKNTQKQEEEEENGGVTCKKVAELQQVMELADAQIDSVKENKINPVTPFVLQIALGIHASLEGLAIGVERDFSKCLTIALAVLVHKWAEGMVLGLALKQSNMNLKRASIMVAIQAMMNPMGIGIGWVLSDAGDLVTGILMSISAGTFVYIATNEVIAEEFNKVRYQLVKSIFYFIGIGFISSLWFVEQATGG